MKGYSKTSLLLPMVVVVVVGGGGGGGGGGAAAAAAAAAEAAVVVAEGAAAGPVTSVRSFRLIPAGPQLTGSLHSVISVITTESTRDDKGTLLLRVK